MNNHLQGVKQSIGSTLIWACYKITVSKLKRWQARTGTAAAVHNDIFILTKQFQPNYVQPPTNDPINDHEEK